MHRTRNLVTAISAALVCASLLAGPAGAAQTTFRFNAGGPNSSSVGVSDGRTTKNGYIALVRGGEIGRAHV